MEEEVRAEAEGRLNRNKVPSFLTLALLVGTSISPPFVNRTQSETGWSDSMRKSIVEIPCSLPSSNPTSLNRERAQVTRKTSKYPDYKRSVHPCSSRCPVTTLSLTEGSEYGKIYK